MQKKFEMSSKRVSFNDNISVLEFINTSEEREYRLGDYWQTNRIRFCNRIEEVGTFLSPLFDEAHRQKIVKRNESNVDRPI